MLQVAWEKGVFKNYKQITFLSGIGFIVIGALVYLMNPTIGPVKLS